MKPIIAVVGIGQSPRIDVMPEIQEICKSIEFIERGALDSLTLEEIRALEPKENDYVLVSRLRDGNSVRMGKQYITPLIQGYIDELSDKVDGVLILCTSTFPDFPCEKIILHPKRILRQFVKSIAHNKRIGILTPDKAQIEASIHTWKDFGIADVVCESASPYADIKSIELASQKIKEKNPEIIVLDCMGYTGEMKKIVARITNVPVILPRTLVARAMSELYG